jgi:hypothetical protein
MVASAARQRNATACRRAGVGLPGMSLDLDQARARGTGRDGPFAEHSGGLVLRNHSTFVIVGIGQVPSRAASSGQ